MESLAKIHYGHQPFHLSFNHHRQSFPKPLSSLSFTTPSQFKLPSIKASSSSNPPHHQQSLQNPKTSVLKTTYITLTTAAALFFIRLHHNHIKPAIAATVPPSTVEPTTETESTENLSLEEQEGIIQENLIRNPDDVESLRSLMEVKIKSRNLPAAIDVINRLIKLEPEETEWPLLKGQIYSYSGEFELAKKQFEEIIRKDPVRVEAYHGLVMASSDDGDSLKDLEKRIQSAMQRCKKEKKNSDFRDFKLLIAQLRVMEGKHSEALRFYEELVKEEPRDFRPYLCQGIIYTLLKKKDEAEKQFDKFRKLVPTNHPYRQYFFDNMVATKLFSGKAERESYKS